jgi:polar amino acid transport system substrate-binding protein
MKASACFALLLMTIGLEGVLAQESEVRRQLLQTGRLRVGINASNILTREVGSDIARDLARRLNAQVVLIEYAGPADVVDAVKEWNIAFIAADPARETAVSFTAPYVELDATYLVRGESAIRTIADADRVGFKIASAAGTAYTLVLQRDITRSTLVSVGNDDALKGLQAGTIDAIAGLRDGLLRIADRVPGARVLPQNITRAQQAIALPKGNMAALPYLDAYLEEAKKSGLLASFVTSAVRKTGFVGASVVQ